MNSFAIIPDFTKLLSYPLAEIVCKPSVPLTLNHVKKEKAAEFAAALAHEIRNPLATISLAAEIIKSGAIKDNQEKYLDIIIRASGRINDLVKDLLAYYQAEEIQPEKYSIHQLLDEVLVTASDRIMLKNITVIKCYTALDCKILVSKQKIKIAFTNIIINAIDAMPFEGGKLTLIIKSINGKCVIEIADNGIGISEKNLNNIFKADFTDKPGGLGIGLSTTLDILESNHAKVHVKSEKGHGTRFILSFAGIPQLGKYLFAEPVAVIA